MTVLTALTAAGCGGSDDSGGTTQTRPQSTSLGITPQTVITIRGSARAIDLGTPLTIDGSVRRHDKPAAGVELLLLKHDNRTAAGDRDQVASTKTAANGTYRFVKRPDRNAFWTVMTKDLAESSASMPVAVSLIVKLRPVVSGGVRSMVYTAYGPPDAKPRRARALLYTAPAGSKRYTRFASVPLEPTGSPRTVATARFTPAPPTTVETLACVEGVVARGWGKFEPPCGPRHITYVRPNG